MNTDLLVGYSNKKKNRASNRKLLRNTSPPPPNLLYIDTDYQKT